MKKIGFLFIVFSLTGCNTRSVSSTYYVSLSGNNNNSGSQSSPWRNLNYALSRLITGDNLCIGTGIWTDGKDIINSQGLSYFPSGNDYSSAVTIGGCNGDKPTIKAPDGLSALKLTDNSPHYIIFHDLILDGSLTHDPIPPAAGDSSQPILYVSSGSHHIRFQRLLIQHSMGNAAQLSTANADINFVTNIEFLDSEFLDIGNATGDSGNGGPGKNNGYAVYDTQRGNLYKNNKFHDTRGFALNIYGSDHIVVGNEFYLTVTRGGGGAGLNFGSSAHPVASENNVAVNNIFHDNPIGLMMYSNSRSFAYNNTFYNNPLGIHIQYCFSAEFKNNIFQRNQTDWINYSEGSCGLIESNNIKSNQDAKLVDPANGDFRLKMDSPAINTGILIDKIKYDYYGITRPQSDHYDIGAAELVSENPNPVETKGKNNIFLTLNGSSTVGTNLILADLICSNTTGDRHDINIQNSGALKENQTNATYTIPANQTLPLLGLNLRFETLIASGNSLSCNFGIVPIE